METKKIVITGGANRIGRSIALELANYDTQIVIHYSKSFTAAKKLKVELENLGSIVHLLKAFDDGALDKKSFVEIPKFIHTEFDPRINTSPFYTAWLKVSEGCNRNCTFCIIPTIRGRLRSRSVSSLVEEAKNLSLNGVKDSVRSIKDALNDNSKDVSKRGEKQRLLNARLRKEKGIQGKNWIRENWTFKGLAAEIKKIYKVHT